MDDLARELFEARARIADLEQQNDDLREASAFFGELADRLMARARIAEAAIARQEALALQQAADALPPPPKAWPGRLLDSFLALFTKLPVVHRT